MRIPPSLRFILKYWVYYLVNVLGMSMSIAIMLLCLLFVTRELTTDRFHKNIRKIYCVDVDGRSGTPFMCAELFKEQLPGVSSFTRLQLWDLKFNVLRYGNDPPLDLDQIIRADTNFFEFFTFSFVSGDPRTCLEKPESLVLTESAAAKLFGNEDPLGKAVAYNKGQMLLTVTAVVKDPPFNSSLDFNAVMSVNSLPVIYPPFSLPGPFFWSFDTFIALDGITPDEGMNATASDIFLKSIPADGVKEAKEIFKSKFMVKLIPYSRVYFNKDYFTSLGKGDMKQVYLFIVIGILIIIVALVNYINLSNAGATMRISDVIIRKILGETSANLFLMSLLESVMLSFLSVFLALVLGNILTGIVNDQQLLNHPLKFFSLQGQLLILVAGSLLTGLAGGIYTAANLASVDPLTSRKHRILSGAVLIRKVLLTFQFFVTACLLVCAIVISRQYKTMTGKPAGFDSGNVIYMRMGNQLKKSYTPFTEKLKQMPQVIRLANARFGFIGGRGPGRAEFMCNGNAVTFDAISFSTDTGFMEMLGLQLASGTSFGEHDNVPHKLIINETALKLMGLQGDLSGITLPDKVHSVTWQVVGVVKDFNTRSPRYPLSPYVFYFVPGDADMDGLYIKLRPDASVAATMDQVKKAGLEFSPDEPLDPLLLDDARKAIYREDNNRMKMFLFFSLFTILVSCLGLYALSRFILERRTRETGIRKVYGADKRSVMVLLTSDMLKMVFAGYLLALPLSWFLMSRWLQNFALKTDLSWWIFLSAGVIILLIAMLSVASEVNKISSENVADIIRYD